MFPVSADDNQYPVEVVFAVMLMIGRKTLNFHVIRLRYGVFSFGDCNFFATSGFRPPYCGFRLSVMNAVDVIL